MGKIDLTINKTGLAHNIQKAKENNVIIPTIAQMQHPETIPEKIQEKLKNVGLWDVEPAEPLPHHLEERGQGVRRSLSGGAELCRDPLRAVRRDPAASSPWRASGSPRAATRSALPSAASPRAL